MVSVSGYASVCFSCDLLIQSDTEYRVIYSRCARYSSGKPAVGGAAFRVAHLLPYCPKARGLYSAPISCATG